MSDYPATISGLPLVINQNRRARRMSLRLCVSSRTIRLTLPPRAPRRAGITFLREYQGWIDEQINRRLAPAIAFAAGSTLPLGDGALHLAAAKTLRAHRDGDTLYVPGEGEAFAGRVRRWLIAEARRQFEPATRELALRIGRDDTQVKLGDFRSRWGSCAIDGRIAYSWRLIMAPTMVQQAVIAHEVAHLVEQNHSAQFWAVATELLGQSHQPARSWLKQHGSSLHAIGHQTL